MTELIVRDDVSFRLGEGWTALSSTSTKGDAWQKWAAGLRQVPGDGTSGFDWMEGLVPPEVQAGSEALAAQIVEEAEASGDYDPEAPVGVPEEFRGYVKTAQRPRVGTWSLAIAGGPEGSIVFLFALDPLGTETTLRRQYEQILRWSGIRVDGGGTGTRFEEVCGDSYGTMDLGLHGSSIRHYEQDRLVTVGFTVKQQDVDSVLDRLVLPKQPRTFEAAPVAAAPTGTLAYDPDWASFIDPKTLRLERVSGFVPFGAVVMEKRREDEHVVTYYFAVEPTGLRPLDDKAAAQPLVQDLVLKLVEASGHLPLHTTLGRRFKNGSLEVIYEPNRYDRFVLKLAKQDVGGRDPIAMFEALGSAPVPTFRAKPVDEDATPWKVEPAKSSRAACRACKEAIEKGGLRLGEPYDYQGSITFRWYHLACASERLRTPEKLQGFEALTEPQQHEVRQALAK